MKEKHFARMLARYRVTDGKKFRLADYAPDDLAEGAVPHHDSSKLLADGVAQLAELQELLYANASWSLLCVFQGMDAAGKDGTIGHVMTGVNPQGVTVSSFKAPGPETLTHDFLWRIHADVPRRGRIGIFNRSHYEDVLITRVHPELLDKTGLPEAVRGRKFWDHRLQDIANFEHYLSHQGVVVLKFYLNMSKAEQRRRFLARIDDTKKNWKFSSGDLRERSFFDHYSKVFEETIQATATDYAPWYVVPADNKWFTHLVVVGAMVSALKALDLKAPELAPEELAKLAAARAELDSE
jgi:PPK2 family polyphosphate:nucleotide phosphotransferase